MSTERIERGCVAIEFDSETREPKTCVIKVSESILLTPNPLSAQAFVVILQRILEAIPEHNSKQNTLSDSWINEALLKARQVDSFEWGHIDAIRFPTGEWKVWLQSRAVSVYLSVKEVERIVRDFEGITTNSRAYESLEDSFQSSEKVLR